MFNKIQLLGDVTNLPEIHLKEDGRSVVIFSLATHTYWRERTYANGEQAPLQKKTEWHRVLVSREPVAAWLQKKLNKGDRSLPHPHLQ